MFDKVNQNQLVNSKKKVYQLLTCSSFADSVHTERRRAHISSARREVCFIFFLSLVLVVVSCGQTLPSLHAKGTYLGMDDCYLVFFPQSMFPGAGKMA